MFHNDYIFNILENLLDKVFPYLTLFLGWALSQYSNEKREKSLDTRKINRLLFNLINLRQILYKESNIEIFFNKIIETIKKTYPKMEPEDLNSSFESMKPNIGEYIKNNILDKQQIEDLENNIDELILEISEVDPFFATVLSFRQNIKERLSDLKNYLSMLENKKNGLYYSDIENYNINPIIKADFLQNVDDNIVLISRRSDKRTRKEIDNLLKSPFFIDEREINDYISKLIRVKK